MKYEIIKGSEKDFEGVPVWALYVETYRGNVFASEGYSAGDRYIALTGLDKGKEFIVDDETNPPGRIIAERRPIIEPVWDGEGLPPVGALCRYRAFSDMPWVECKVLAWHDDEVWLKRTEDGKTFTLGNPELFPIRSPEDLARDEATKAFNDIGVMNLIHARQIYDAIAAGKIPGISLSGK